LQIYKPITSWAVCNSSNHKCLSRRSSTMDSKPQMQTQVSARSNSSNLLNSNRLICLGASNRRRKRPSSSPLTFLGASSLLLRHLNSKPQTCLAASNLQLRSLLKILRIFLEAFSQPLVNRQNKTRRTCSEGSNLLKRQSQAECTTTDW